MNKYDLQLENTRDKYIYGGTWFKENKTYVGIRCVYLIRNVMC